MPEPTPMEIVRRAYELWQQAGEPTGRDEEFYHQAERELQDADKSSPLRSGQSVVPCHCDDSDPAL
jgi:hypothetical protein